MSTQLPDDSFDLFVSYAHLDDAQGWITALVAQIEATHARFTPTPLQVFFDRDAIRSMDDWELRILKGIRESKLMVAVLSPNYFASAYCKREWAAYLERELAQALPGDGIAPIYVVSHPAFDSSDGPQLDEWLKNLQRRQYLDIRPWWQEGPKALEQLDVARRLEDLEHQLNDRLERLRQRQASRSTVPEHNRNFVGRRDELHDLRKKLVGGQVGAITAVQGIGGIGKSALAFEYARAFVDDYPGGRFLVSAARLTDLRAAFAKLAPELEIQFDQREQLDLAAQWSRLRRALESREGTLVVLDNVDDARFLAPRQLAQYLPDPQRVHVLATTRLDADRLPGVACLPLDQLKDDEGLALLEKYRPFPTEDEEDEWKAALAIVRRLGGHALALELVAVYLWQNPEISYAGYRSRLEAEGMGALDVVAGDPYVELTRHPEKFLGRLLEPTLSQLAPAESRVVEYAALAPPDTVPLPWLRDLASRDFPELATPPELGYPDAWKGIVRRLQGLRLVTPSDDPRVGRIHRLVQDVVRSRLGDGVRQVMESRLADHAYSSSERLAARWGQRDLAWELAALRDMAYRLIEHGDRRGWLQGENIATGLLHTGRLLDLGELRRRSHQLLATRCEAAPENADYARDLSISFNKLGDLSRALGDTAAARRYYEDALAVRRRLAEAAPDSADYARDLSISNERLGDLSRALGDTAAARRYYEDALAVRRRLAEAAPDSADYARDLSISNERLGDLSRALGDTAAARRYYEDALAVRRRLAEAAPDSADYARDLSISNERLGDLSRALGDTAAARRYYEDALAVRRRLAEAAPDSADYARDLSISNERLGDLSRALGDTAAARRYYEDALAVRRRLAEAAPDSADYARDLSISNERLGDLSRALGDTAAARRYYEDALAVRRRLAEAAPDSADYARDLSISFNKLGDLSLALGDTAAARRYYEDALAVSRRLAEAAPENADYARDLAVSYYKLSRLHQQTYEQAAAMENLRRCHGVLRRMRECGMHLDGPAAQLFERLEDMFGG